MLMPAAPDGGVAAPEHGIGDRDDPRRIPRKTRASIEVLRKYVRDLEDENIAGSFVASPLDIAGRNINNADGSCHGGAFPAEGLDMSTAANAYNQLVGVAARQCTTRPLRVKAGDAGASYLVNKITGQGMCFGSKMPKGAFAGALSAADVALISRWIDEGALNN